MIDEFKLNMGRLLFDYPLEDSNDKTKAFLLNKMFDLWVEYLNYYDVSFQELSRTFNIEYSFPKWLEENKK